ncbi:MAG TPA: DNA polymerase IV [Anaerovoracaceae bacterium]|nr:DNA polymerase IV [Anaerovoracaceae bacterium]
MTILHIDANSAFLSWTSAWLLENGETLDLRTVPSAIAGNPKNRHGIILAKSIPTKKYGIKTGQPLYEAISLCPDILIYPPNFDLYISCSEAMLSIISEYSSKVERYSVDECFLDYVGSEKLFGNSIKVGNEIRKRIEKELGFTVNVGIGDNKLLAKMAGQLEKPNMTHTIFREEIREKLWPLSVGKLFMVGRATERKLKKININTIGELANTDMLFLKAMLKSQGILIWNYANGIDNTKVIPNNEILRKGISNSMTIKYDVYEKEEVHMYLLSLAERVSLRLRNQGFKTSLIGIRIRNSELIGYTHQMRLNLYIDSTSNIYEYACMLFDHAWKGEPVRQLGISLSELCKNDNYQISIYEKLNISYEKNQKADFIVDEIRDKFGETSIYRGTFANTNIKPLEGGTNNGNFIMMGGNRR